MTVFEIGNQEKFLALDVNPEIRVAASIGNIESEESNNGRI